VLIETDGHLTRQNTVFPCFLIEIDPVLHTDCPRFLTCCAALCPLEPAWREVQHLPGEKVCKYLLDSGKAGAAERYADDPTFAAVMEQREAVCRKHRAIEYEVERAARSGFRKSNLPHLRSKDSVEGDKQPNGREVTPSIGV
jgi:hypothetical protein